MAVEFSPAVIPYAVFGLYILLVIIIACLVWRRNAGRIRDRNDIRLEKKFKVKFFRSLTEGFQLESIKSIDDILNIYEAVSSFGDEDVVYRYGLSRYLREYLVALISKDDKIIPRTTSESEIIEWKNILDRIISENDITVPYSDLPPLERNILNDITVYLKKGDTEHINDKLKELSRLIKSRDGELERVYRRNSVCVMYMILSFLLSIIFAGAALYIYFK